MKRRTILGALAAKAVAVGAVALVNRSLRLDDLPPTLPGRMHDWTWRHGRVRYTTLGDGPPLVLVHGVHAAASSFEMREIFEPLAQRFTVYAVDLLGFGKSERPAIHYTDELYAELVGDFLREVVGEPARVVASSLSAAYAIEAAIQRPELVDRLVLICPTGEAGVARSGLLSGALYWLVRSPIWGEALFNALVSRRSIRYFLERMVYADPAAIGDARVEQHRATGHQPNARYAPAAFIAGRLSIPLRPRIGRVAKPIMLVWGSEARRPPPSEAAALRAENPAVDVRIVEGAGLLPHDEQPKRFLEAIVPFLEVPRPDRATG